MNYSVFDIETNGLLDCTKIHCLSVAQYKNGVWTFFTLTDYDEMISFLLSEEVLVGHNIIRFDIPVLERILGIKIVAKVIDTLGLSWYLYPNRLKHGLEEWGVEFGIPKPPVVDWENLPIEVYIHRCSEDVQINKTLFLLQWDYLVRIYGTEELVHRLTGYLTFKLLCAREQEEVGWRLDVIQCETSLKFLQEEALKKTEVLKVLMPKITKYKNAERPKVLYKKDGSPSSHGQKWLDILSERNLPSYHIGTIQIPIGEVEGNPGSHQQLKSWLFSLGWIPQTFKYEKEEDGSQRKIPQISSDDGSGVCESVKFLYEKLPELEVLEGLFILRHRISILKGFLNNNINGVLKAEIKGFTNTLRFQHTTIVNLPTIPKPYWKEVRGCLIAPDENHVLCGSDMSGLEDNTKRHYMFYYDPEYVKEMMSPDFDPHLDIAVLARMITVEQMEEHKLYDKTKGQKGKSYKVVRAKAKRVNFAGVYGAGPPKIALTANIPLSEAKVLHTTYWKRNWAVKKIAQDCTVKTIGGQMWLFNPVSQLWYSLRSDKDRFSTLNQGTGVYCFDSWVRKVREQGIKNCGQFHDEIISPVLKDQKEEHKAKLLLALKNTNDELGLNVELRISIDFGNNYAEIH